MTPVIKSADLDRGGAVRALALDPPVAPPSREARIIADLEARLTAAQERIATLEVEAARLRQDVQTASARGREAGLAEGRRSAEDRAEALVAAVSAAAGRAVEDFEARLESLDVVAAGLASLALERIAGDPAARRDLVAGAVRRALAETAAGAVVRIEVARADFAAPEALAAAVGTLTAEAVAVDAPSGFCRIRLRLGEIDLDLDGQIARLRALLDAAVGEGGPA